MHITAHVTVTEPLSAPATLTWPVAELVDVILNVLLTELVIVPMTACERVDKWACNCD